MIKSEILKFLLSLKAKKSFLRQVRCSKETKIALLSNTLSSSSETDLFCPSVPEVFVGSQHCPCRLNMQTHQVLMVEAHRYRNFRISFCIISADCHRTLIAVYSTVFISTTTKFSFITYFPLVCVFSGSWFTGCNSYVGSECETACTPLVVAA